MAVVIELIEAVKYSVSQLILFLRGTDSLWQLVRTPGATGLGATDSVNWILLATEFVASFFADLCAGTMLAGLGALLAWKVGQKLNLFERAEERRERQRRETRRAVEWLTLLKGEVDDLVGKVPQWRTALRSVPWGKVFNISTPIWDLAEQSGELASLADPQLLRKLARFYYGLGHAREWIPLIAQSWMVDDSKVTAVGDKRSALIAMAVQALDQAENAGDGLVAKLDSEVERLEAMLGGTGGNPSARSDCLDGEGGRL